MNIEDMGERTVRERLVAMVHKSGDSRLVAILIAILAVTVIYFVVGKNNQTQDLLASQRVVLENGGSFKAVVALDKSGPEIRMLDAAGIPWVAFHVEDDKAIMALQDSQAHTRLVLSGGKTTPVLSMGEDQNQTVSLTLDNLGPNFGFSGAGVKLNLRPAQAGVSGFEILDGNNQPKIALNLEAIQATLSFLDDAGRINTQVRVDEAGVHLSLLDPNNLVRAKGSIQNDQIEMAFFDSLGRKRAGVVSENGSRDLVFFDDAAVARQSIALSDQNISLKLLDFEVPVPAEVPTEPASPTVSVLGAEAVQ